MLHFHFHPFKNNKQQQESIKCLLFLFRQTTTRFHLFYSLASIHHPTRTPPPTTCAASLSPFLQTTTRYTTPPPTKAEESFNLPQHTRLLLWNGRDTVGGDCRRGRTIGCLRRRWHSACRYWTTTCVRHSSFIGETIQESAQKKRGNPARVP
jgi:hypothetical protein